MNPEKVLSTVMEVVAEKNGKDPIALNLQGVSTVADYFVICHGNSEVQVKAIVAELKRKMAAASVGIKNVEGLDTARWVLVDLGDVVVHVFHREDREFYKLERLWTDAKVVESV